MKKQNESVKNLQFSLRVPADTMAKISHIAFENGRSANKEIEQLILKHIKEYEEDFGTIKV